MGHVPLAVSVAAVLVIIGIATVAAVSWGDLVGGTGQEPQRGGPSPQTPIDGKLLGIRPLAPTIVEG